MKINVYLILCFCCFYTFSACDFILEEDNRQSPPSESNSPRSTNPINQANSISDDSSNDRELSNGNNTTADDINKIDDYLPTQDKGNQLVKHSFYVASYSTKHKNSEWIAYELTSSRLRAPDIERSSNFKGDPTFEGEASSSDYTHSGYDRGHLAPAHDMNFNKKAMEESFLMTNVCPQNPDFNRGIWKKLEHQVRTWAEKNGHLYIITGPILRSRLSSRTEKIGDGVSVPRAFYKVILADELPERKGIAFILKNKASDQPLSRFVVSIDEVEERTGLDFFPKLPKAEQKKLEERVDVQAWKDLLE